jgi:glycosyltransferase involved in cell wall biosynthesis
MSSKALVTVLLPVFNAEQYLGEALESLARQTMRDFEVVAVDDGSTDRSGGILAEAARRWPWFSLIVQENQGLAAALNTAFRHSRSPFVARMDADDIALPERLARQLSFLNAHPEVAVCGTAMRTIGVDHGGQLIYPQGDSAIKARLVFGCAIAHPTVMARRNAFARQEGPYAGSAEDYDLWLRLGERDRFENLPDLLHLYRIHPGQYSTLDETGFCARAWEAQEPFLRRLGVPSHELDRGAHALCGPVDPRTPEVSLRRVVRWLMRIERQVNRWCGTREIRSECTRALMTAVVRAWRLARIRNVIRRVRRRVRRQPFPS